MTHPTRSALSLPELPWLAASALAPAILLLQHWEPCDSTASIASGDSILSIGLCLVVGVFAAAGVALEPSILPMRRLRSALAIACALAVAWLALATFTISGRGNLRFAVNGFWQWASMLVWGTSIGLLATRPGFARLGITAMIALGFGMLVYGFWEYGVIQPELRRELERDPAGLFQRQGVSLESSAGLILADRIRSTEMKGVYALANSLGGFLAGFWVLVLGTWSARRSRAWLVVNGALLGAIAFGLLLTKSRTAWVAAGVGTILLGLFSVMAHGRLRGRTLGFGVLAAIAVSGIGLLIIYRFDPLILQEAGKSLAYRFDYWRGAASLIAQEPWTGFGVGNFQSTYVHVKLPTAAESPADPHNFLLETAHAGGIPCLILVSIAIGLSLGIAILQPRDSSPEVAQARVVSRPLAIAFWSGVAISSASVLAWIFIVDSGDRLVGAILAMAVSAMAASAGTWWSVARTSVQSLVQKGSALWIAFAVMLIHFLASGGWLLPGTMSMGALVLGVCLGGPLAVAGERKETGRSEMLPRGVRRLGWIGAGAILLVAWYATMAVPISRGLDRDGMIMGGAIREPSPRQVWSLTEADPWDPELARKGIDWAVVQLARPMGKEPRREWETVLSDLQKEFLARDPQNALAWDACGQASMRVAATAGDSKGRNPWISEADRAFERASQLAPASAQGHLQAALAASLVGDWNRAIEHCSQSEKIDSATPHRDRKINVAVLVWPAPLVPSEVGLGSDARRGLSQDQVKAEPVLRYLRNRLTP
jgi:O-antigen ligase/proteasome lid subunit RPN8/RPN11